MGDSPLSVQFSDESTGSITSYSWDFGDSGNINSTEPLSHIYNSRNLQREPDGNGTRRFEFQTPDELYLGQYTARTPGIRLHRNTDDRRLPVVSPVH